MKKLGIFLIAIFFIVACEKNSDYKLQLIIDDNQDMIITSYNLFLESVDTLDLDINQDSIPDFRLIKNRYLSSSIICLNPNSYLLGKHATDTTFLYKETIESCYYRADTIYKVEIENRSNYGECRYTQNDSIINITPNQFKLNPKKYNDLINSNELFISDTADLYISFTPLKVGDDTIISHKMVTILGKSYEATVLETTEYDRAYCQSLPSDHIVYIGVKLEVQNKELIGWIKLAVGDNGNNLLVFNSAIQNK